MAVICPQCNTKNRSVAKFCIECIEALPTRFADEQLARHTATSSVFAFARRGSTATSDATPSATGSVTAAAVPYSKGLWVSIAGLSIALIIGAAGWLVAGAGGWYFYSAGKAQVHPALSEPAIEAPVVQPVAPVRIPDAPDVPAPTPPPAAPAQQRGGHAQDLPPPAEPDRANRKTPSSPRVVRAGQPSEACAGLNFVAAARCMATQCLKIEFKAHPQCHAVRRQQRIEDEKRNPAAP